MLIALSFLRHAACSNYVPRTRGLLQLWTIPRFCCTCSFEMLLEYVMPSLYHDAHEITSYFDYDMGCFSVNVFVLDAVNVQIQS